MKRANDGGLAPAEPPETDPSREERDADEELVDALEHLRDRVAAVRGQSPYGRSRWTLSDCEAVEVLLGRLP